MNSKTTEGKNALTQGTNLARNNAINARKLPDNITEPEPKPDRGPYSHVITTTKKLIKTIMQVHLNIFIL